MSCCSVWGPITGAIVWLYSRSSEAVWDEQIVEELQTQIRPMAGHELEDKVYIVKHDGRGY